MADVIPLPLARRRGAPRPEVMPVSAAILFFTGVRYERPAEREAERHREARAAARPPRIRKPAGQPA